MLCNILTASGIPRADMLRKGAHFFHPAYF